MECSEACSPRWYRLDLNRAAPKWLPPGVEHQQADRYEGQRGETANQCIDQGARPYRQIRRYRRLQHSEGEISFDLGQLLTLNLRGDQFVYLAQQQRVGDHLEALI